MGSRQTAKTAGSPCKLRVLCLNSNTIADVNVSSRWSYNQGVVLGGLVELNRAAPDPSYLKAASGIAKAAIETLVDSNDVIHDTCEPNSCDANARQFKGIFIRNLRLLHSVTPNDEYAKIIRACAESIWARGRNRVNNQLGVSWAGPITQVDASTHSSAMDALVAAIAIS